MAGRSAQSWPPRVKQRTRAPSRRAISGRTGQLEFFDKEFAKTTAQAAATAIIAGIEKNAPRILIGGDARMLDRLQRILPGTYFRILKRRMAKREGQASAPAAADAI